MSFTRHTLKAVPLAGLGAVLAAMLSGCGGATTGGAVGIATPDSSPVIYGLDAQAAIGGTYNETSGLGYTDSTTGTQIGVLTGATGYKTDFGPGPLPVYQNNFSTGIPLGFSNVDQFITTAAEQALPTTAAGAVFFRAYVSPGAKSGASVDLNTSSIVLTSSEAPTFSQPMTFDGPGIGVGPLGQGQYTTGTFALPAALATTGLHNLHTTVSDVAGQKSETDFSFLALAPTDSAALVAVTYKVGNTTLPVAGATVTITNPLPTVAAYKDASAPTGDAALPLTTSYTDAQGVGLVFAPPGAQTVTVSGVSPFDGKTAITGTAQVTLVAGVVNTSVTVGGVPAATTATPAAIANAKRTQRHSKK